MLVIRNRKLFLSVITLFYMTTLLYTLTYAQPLTYAKLYSALDMFLNAKALEAEVSKRVKTLDERVKELDEEIIPDKKAVHLTKSTALIQLHMNLSSMENAEAAAKKALSEADTATATAEANKTSAKKAVSTSTKNEYQAYLAWHAHSSFCIYPECSTKDQLRNAWDAANKQLAEDNAALATAKSALKACKKAQREAQKTYSDASMALGLNRPYIEHGISELNLEVPRLQTEIDSLEAELKSKKEELVVKRARLAEIKASYPTVRAYMIAFINASTTEGSAFDFDEYINQHPPPSIIFDSE